MEEKLYYKNWRVAEGKGFPVNTLDFIEYVKDENGKPVQFTIEDKKYEGQIWQCEYGGKKMKLIFRFEVVDSVYAETTLTNRVNAIADYSVNPITDSWEEVTLGVNNKKLFPSIYKRKAYLRCLKKLNAEFPMQSTLRISLLKTDSKKQLEGLYKSYMEIPLDTRVIFNQKLNDIFHW